LDFIFFIKELILGRQIFFQQSSSLKELPLRHEACAIALLWNYWKHFPRRSKTTLSF